GELEHAALVGDAVFAHPGAFVGELHAGAGDDGVGGVGDDAGDGAGDADLGGGGTGRGADDDEGEDDTDDRRRGATMGHERLLPEAVDGAVNAYIPTRPR